MDIPILDVAIALPPMGLVLALLAGLASAFLNNVTAILFLAPLTIHIAQMVGIHRQHPLHYRRIASHTLQ